MMATEGSVGCKPAEGSSTIRQNDRFAVLRTKLSSLQYFDDLSEQSCPLVERLLDDVLKSVDNFQRLSARCDGLQKQLHQSKGEHDEVKKQPTRLLEEISDLHNQIFELEKRNRDSSSSHSLQMKAMNDTKANLTFQNEQSRQQSRELEQTIKRLKLRIEHICKAHRIEETFLAVESSAQPVIHTLHNYASTCLIVLHQEMESSAVSDEPGNLQDVGGHSPIPSHMVEVLSKQIECHEAAQKTLNQEIDALRSDLDVANKDRVRMARVIEIGGLSKSAVDSLDNSREIQRLNVELDMLNAKYQELRSRKYSPEREDRANNPTRVCSRSPNSSFTLLGSVKPRIQDDVPNLSPPQLRCCNCSCDIDQPRAGPREVKDASTEFPENEECIEKNCVAVQTVIQEERVHRKECGTQADEMAVQINAPDSRLREGELTMKLEEIKNLKANQADLENALSKTAAHLEIERKKTEDLTSSNRKSSAEASSRIRQFEHALTTIQAEVQLLVQRNNYLADQSRQAQSSLSEALGQIKILETEKRDSQNLLEDKSANLLTLKRCFQERVDPEAHRLTEQKYRETEAQAASLREEVEDLKSRIANNANTRGALVSQAEQLAGALECAKESRLQLIEASRSQEAKIEMSASRLHKLEEEATVTRGLLSRLQAEERALRAALRTGDSERDTLQQQLDTREEQFHAAECDVQRCKIEISNLQQYVQELQNCLERERQSCADKLKDSELKVESLDKNMATLSADLEQAKSVSKQAVEDLAHVCRENQALNDKISQSTHIIHDHETAQKQRQLDTYSATQEIRRTQIQRDNVIISYNKLVDDKVRLDEQLRLRDIEATKMENERQIMLREAADHMHQLSVSRQAHQTVLNDFVALRNQMTQIAGTLERQSESAVQQEVREEQRKQDVLIAQATCQQMELVRIEYQRDIATMETDKRMIIGELDRIKIEMETKAKESSELKDREEHLERIIADQRLQLLQQQQANVLRKASGSSDVCNQGTSQGESVRHLETPSDSLHQHCLIADKDQLPVQHLTPNMTCTIDTEQVQTT
eukprot:GHVQ01027928.1.p1 GENE.GHVQ01027928.1~~GHVQ01027928.1.p1  ORF type:complete len:1053 (+),score=159.56 GHVQ01027928.1:153-3311(+)